MCVTIDVGQFHSLIPGPAVVWVEYSTAQAQPQQEKTVQVAEVSTQSTSTAAAASEQSPEVGRYRGRTLFLNRIAGIPTPAELLDCTLDPENLFDKVGARG